MSPSTPYTDVLGIRPQPVPRREQTPVLFPGKLLPIDIYDVYDSFLSQSISPYSTASPSDSRTLTVAVKNNGIPSVAVEYMDQIPHAAIP
jgi:hypothetical protein